MVGDGLLIGCIALRSFLCFVLILLKAMSTAVPPIAARWIANVLRGPDKDTTQLEARLQHFGGLNCLLVRDLKYVWCQLEGKPSVLRKRLPQPRGKKAVYIDKLRRYFYQDPTCSIPDDALLNDLQRELQETQENSSIAFSANPHPRPSDTLGTIATAPFSLHPFTFGRHNGIQTHALSTNASQKRPHAVAFSTSFNFPRVFVKQEGALQEENHQPKNAMEMNLMTQLQQMGFTDRCEILSTIRRLIENNPGHPLMPDAVMIDIVTQREEAEEARKMDEARLQSERARKEDARKRRIEIEEQFEQRLRAANFQDWSSDEDMFPDSWILSSHARTVLVPMLDNAESLKLHLLQLLKLEKKARKWYGTILPSGYFGSELPERLVKTCTAKAMAVQIQKEIEKLEIGMYNLSEQKAGVPRILLEAHEATSKQRKASGSQDEDEVMVVDAELLPQTQRGCPSKAATKSLASNDIIEILQ